MGNQLECNDYIEKYYNKPELLKDISKDKLIDYIDDYIDSINDTYIGLVEYFFDTIKLYMKNQNEIDEPMYVGKLTFLRYLLYHMINSEDLIEENKKDIKDKDIEYSLYDLVNNGKISCIIREYAKFDITKEFIKRGF